MKIKALSLWQPWASLMAHGLKLIETRSWSYPWKLPAVLAIHASKRDPQADCMALAHLPGGEGRTWRSALTEIGCTVREFEKSGFYGLSTRELPRGSVLAVGRLVESVGTKPFRGLVKEYHAARPDERCFGDYSTGRYAWVFDLMVRVGPIPARGAQGLWDWEVPPDVEAKTADMAAGVNALTGGRI